MRLWGNRRRLCFSGWLAAALVLLGVNGLHLLALENQQLVGHSPTIRALRVSLQQWDKARWTGFGAIEGIAIQPVQVRHKLPDPKNPKQVPSAIGDAISEEASAVIALPDLKGVIQAVDRQGRRTHWAIFEEGVCRVKDRVAGFLVERVSNAGVVLRREGRQWHLHSPNPAYSEDQGN